MITVAKVPRNYGRVFWYVAYKVNGEWVRTKLLKTKKEALCHADTLEFISLGWEVRVEWVDASQEKNKRQFEGGLPFQD